MRCSCIYVCVSGNIRASAHAVPINNQSIKDNKTNKSYFLNGGEVTSGLKMFDSLGFARGHFGSAQVYFHHFPSILSSARPSTQAAPRRNLNRFTPPKHLFPFKANFMRNHAEALKKVLIYSIKKSDFLPVFCKLICTFNQFQASLV